MIFAAMERINRLVRSGEITPGERTRMREEFLVDSLIKDYTKGLITIDARKRRP